MIKVDRELGTRQLIAAYGDRLFKTAVCFCGDEQLSQDLVMRTLVKAIEGIDGFNRESTLFTWLYRILRNFFLMERRGKAATMLEYRDEVPEREDPAPSPADCLSKKTEAQVIRRFVAIMPPLLREVIVCFYFNDMEVAEVAFVLGIPEGTVKSRLNHARAWLREKIKRTELADRASKD